MVDKKLLNKVSDELKKQGLTVATAESCTGGLLSHSLTNIPGSSSYFECGIISYSNNAKKQFLKIPDQILTTYGAVSPQTAEAMAKAIRTETSTDIGLATTGIAGPGGGTKEKPVGLVYIAISTKEQTKVTKHQFSDDRLTNKENTCNAALEILLQTLTGDTP